MLNVYACFVEKAEIDSFVVDIWRSVLINHLYIHDSNMGCGAWGYSRSHIYIKIVIETSKNDFFVILQLKKIYARQIFIDHLLPQPFFLIFFQFIWFNIKTQTKKPLIVKNKLYIVKSNNNQAYVDEVVKCIYLVFI